MKLTILGAGGHGRVVADLAEELGYTDISFLDDEVGQIIASGVWPVVGPLDAVPGEGDLAVGMGNNTVRLKVLGLLPRAARVLVHPGATVSQHAEIGAGSVICAGAVVAPFAKIGEGCIVNTGASVDHDCVLADGVHISPGARLGGGVFVGARAWVGIGAVVREYKSIGADAMIGAGAAVTIDVPQGARMGGVPAKEF
ncbi:MAG: acetyltransferase [Pseudomonadota bacterium]